MTGTGTFTSDNGIIWNYINVDSNKDEETMTDAFIIMRRGSSLSATIPGGIGELHFAMHKNAEIEVAVDGKSMGTFKPIRQGGWNNHYFKIRDLKKTGDVTVEFTCRSNRAVMDNISWTVPKLMPSAKKKGAKMIIDKLVEKLPIRSNFTKLIAGSILMALVIALWMVGILKLLVFSINPAIPAVLGVVGAATYAAVTRK